VTINAHVIKIFPFPSVFNVGDYRRKELQKFPGHDFFLSRNREGTAVRNKVALDALQVRKTHINRFMQNIDKIV